MILFVIIYNFCGVGNIDDEKIKIIVDFDFIVEILKKKKIIVYFICIYDNFFIIYLKCLFFLVMLIWMEILIGLG